MLELRQLRYFVAVAEALHFTQAAQTLGIAQPALSQQIKRLEATLGFPLLQRDKRTVELTAAGEAFLPEARRTLAQAERAVQRATDAHRGQSARLSIGFPLSFTRLADVLAAYREVRPNVALSLHGLTSAQQRRALYGRTIDIGFARHMDADAALHSQALLWEPLRLAVATAHPFAHQGLVSFKALRKELFILFPEHLGPGFYAHLTGLCKRAGFSPHVVQEAVQMRTILSLVAGGLGLAIVPEAACSAVSSVQYLDLDTSDLKDPHSGSSVVGPGTTLQARTRLDLVWRRGEGSSTLGAFIEVAIQTLRNARAST